MFWRVVCKKMSSSLLTNLFKHEFSESPDLLAVLGVIHDVVLHEKGLRAGKRSISYI